MVRHIFDRYFCFPNRPKSARLKGFLRFFAFVRCEHRLCSQMRHAINCATPGLLIFCKISDFEFLYFNFHVLNEDENVRTFRRAQLRTADQYTHHNLRNVLMTIEKNPTSKKKIKHDGTGRYPKKHAFACFFLANDSNFDRNPLRGCNYGFGGVHFLILGVHFSMLGGAV